MPQDTHVYKEIWLQKNPHRSRQWLTERLMDGFDIHHMDGDHSNNDPDNLVLIEHADHMAIHGLSMMSRKPLQFRPIIKPEPTEFELEMWCCAYELAVELAKTRKGGVWTRVARQMIEKYAGQGLYNDAVFRMAKRWAERAELPWPIVDRNKSRASAAQAA